MSDLRPKALFIAPLLYGIGLLACTESICAQEPQKIYRCVVNDRTVYADRPCANDQRSEEIELAPSNTYHQDLPTSTHRTVRQTRSTVSTHRNDDSIAEAQLKAKQQCQRLADQLDVIESKLRAGYTIKVGERLKERQRQLEQRRRTEKCR